MTRLNIEAQLNEGWDEHYKIPVLQHPSITDIKLRLSSLALHRVLLPNSHKFDFYAKLERSDTLFVSLHGAVPLASPRYPHFRRVESMKNRVSAVLCIADPTLQLLDDSQFRLGWYTGGEDWDPMLELAELVGRIQKFIGARRVMFLGSSGGGFAALRISTLFPGSMAFVQDPQTNVGAYYAGHRDRLISSTWPGWEPTAAFSENPERFNMLNFYPSVNPNNYIYYRQSSSDVWHLKNHAEPFREAIAETDGTRLGHYRFVYEPGEKPGHGKITPEEFDHHFNEAMTFWSEAASV